MSKPMLCPWCDSPIPLSEGREAVRSHILKCLKSEKMVMPDFSLYHPEVADEDQLELKPLVILDPEGD